MLVQNYSRRLITAGKKNRSIRAALAMGKPESPRQWVLYAFLSLVDQGGAIGIPRHPAETSQAYASRLSNFFKSQTLQGSDDLAEYIHGLAQVFEQARYTQQNIMDSQAANARNTLSLIHKFLRKHSNRSQE
jgi:hypothetical protein